MSPDIIITSRPQLLRYLADELDGSLYDQLASLDSQVMEDQLIKRAYKELNILHQADVLMEEISNSFFSDRKGFKREFHLILFPFFTSFVNSLEALEIDSATIINKHFFIPHFNTISFATKQQLLSAINQWVISYSSLEELKASACERFIWFLSSFWDRLKAIPLSDHKSQQDAYSKLRQSITLALVPMLPAMEPWNEELAAIHLGNFLEDLVTPLLPVGADFMAKVKFSNRHRYLTQLTLLLEDEREHYQHQLTAAFTSLYHQCYGDMEHAWRLYRHQFTQHLTRISNYLDNLII